jgi:MtN3 and saliva related transmembrane protein
MTTTNIIDLIGYIAASCTTLSFIPQVIKIKREGGAGLSYMMLCIYLFGLGLWLAYGILIHASAVVVANAASFALVALAIFLKATIKVQSSNLPANQRREQVVTTSEPEGALECR